MAHALAAPVAFALLDVILCILYNGGGVCVKSEDFGTNSREQLEVLFFLLNQDLQHLG